MLELARRALQEDVKRDTLLSSPGKVRDYLRLMLARLEHEVFVALYMDSQNRLIATEELFRGHIDANQRLSARSRQARAEAQRSGSHLCA